MKTMLMPFTLLSVLTGCAEDPHVAEISGLRGIIAQMDMDKSKAADECGIIAGDYAEAKRNRDVCYERGTAIGVVALEYVKLAGIKTDEMWVCRPETSDTHPDPRPAYITTEWSVECENATSFRFVYDAAGNPSFAPYEE